jgi:hypothetical protein
MMMRCAGTSLATKYARSTQEVVFLTVESTVQVANLKELNINLTQHEYYYLCVKSISGSYIGDCSSRKSTG